MPKLTFESIAVPLREDDQGAIRVGSSRVLLDLVIGEFQRGATPEEIVDAFESLALADVYAVISYYLRNPEPIHDYLLRREQEAKIIREKIEASQPLRPNLRAMSLARARARENAHAPVDQR
jgi:uncharacterized protein (DUF433 family)